MKQKNHLLRYIALAILVGVLAALLVLPIPQGGRGKETPTARHTPPPPPHPIVEGQDDLLHRLFFRS